MAATKTMILGDLPEPVRAVYERDRDTGRAMSKAVAHTPSDTSESTTRFVARPAKPARGSQPWQPAHAAPCPYHLSEPAHTDDLSPGNLPSRVPPPEAASARATQAERHRHEAKHHLLRKDYVRALDAMQFALRNEASARNEALYAWVLHLGTSVAGAGGRVHPRVWQHIESALRRDPKDEDANLYHARLLKLVGRSDDAQHAFQRVTRINPGNQEAVRELRCLDMRSRSRSASSGFMQRVLGRKSS